jgi:phage-related protein
MNKEWQVIYYSRKDGSMPVKEYIINLSRRERAKVMAFIGLLEGRGPNLPRPYADILDEGIHELRIRVSGTHSRILYFFCYQDIIVLTNVFNKHSDKVPEAQIKLAKESRADFLARFTENDIRRTDHNEIQRSS